MRRRNKQRMRGKKKRGKMREKGNKTSINKHLDFFVNCNSGL